MNKPGFHTLNRRVARVPTLVEELAALVRDDILSGRLGPGDQLPTEKELIETMNVSRTVVREAVAQLRAEGLVTTRQGLGAFVATDALVRPLRFEPDSGSVESLLKLTELRLAIELEGAALAALRATPGQLARIGTATAEFVAAAERDGSAAEEDFQFHLAIAEATQNVHFPRMITFLGQYIIPRKAGVIEAPHDAQYIHKMCGEHQAIADAVQARDPEAARAAVRVHLGGSRDRLERIAGTGG